MPEARIQRVLYDRWEITQQAENQFNESVANQVNDTLDGEGTAHRLNDVNAGSEGRFTTPKSSLVRTMSFEPLSRYVQLLRLGDKDAEMMIVVVPEDSGYLSTSASPIEAGRVQSR
jgi:hypothetical protein